jgi:hypothetical protein
MSTFLSQLTKSERTRLLGELNYMNLEEIRGFCSERGIPYRIVAEHSDGKVKATKDTDRKPIVLARCVIRDNGSVTCWGHQGVDNATSIQLPINFVDIPGVH